MCAIFGLVNYRHLISKKHLKTLINRLAVASEVRGTDASGIAYVKNGKLVIYKRPLPALQQSSVYGQDGGRQICPLP